MSRRAKADITRKTSLAMSDWKGPSENHLRYLFTQTHLDPGRCV